MKKEARTTILVSLPPETVKKLVLLKAEKGMFVNRFVETVAREYVSNEDIVKALYFMKDGDGFSRVQRSFSLPASLLDSLRAVRTASGLSLSRILSRIVTHGLVELEEDLPFGSTLKGYVEKSNAFQSVIPGRPLGQD